MNFTEHHLQMDDGLSLYYRNYGSGKDAVLCLPGLTRNSKDFHEIAGHLATRFRVLCPDLRGRGESGRDPDWRNYKPETYISDAWRLIDRLGISHFHLIGTSLGGLLAMIMASQRPAQIQTIVLNDIGPEVDPAGYARILTSVGRPVVVNSWQQATEHCRQTYEPVLPGLSEVFWNDFARKTFREGADGRPELDMDPNIGRAIHESRLHRLADAPVDPWDAFKASSMPCLVLRGELSDILSEDIVKRMANVRSDLQQVVIPLRGHAPLLHEPDARAAIDAFLG